MTPIFSSSRVTKLRLANPSQQQLNLVRPKHGPNSRACMHVFFVQINYLVSSYSPAVANQSTITTDENPEEKYLSLNELGTVLHKLSQKLPGTITTKPSSI